MKIITKTGLIWGMACGIGIGVSSVFFGGAKLIQGMIIGLVSATYTVIVASKVDQSENYPYWKINKNGKEK